MARRRTKQPQIVLDEQLEPAIAVEPTPEPAEPAQPRSRRPFFRVPLDENGVPQLDALEADKRAALVDAVQRLPERGAVDPALAGMLISAVAQLEAAVLAARFSLPRGDVAQTVLPRPPFDELLARQTATVLSKHNVFGRFGDELALLALVASWQAGVIQSVRELAVRSKRAAAQKSQTGENVSNATSEE